MVVNSFSLCAWLLSVEVMLIKGIAMLACLISRKSIHASRCLDLYRSGIGLKWALPGVVVGVVMPFSVSIGNAFELLVTDIVICVGVCSWSVDTLLT